MNIVMTLLVRDEEDIIRQNIDYHLSRGISFIIVTDNRSIDGTRDIVEEYVRAGVVEVIDEKENNFNQVEWVTRMALLAFHKYSAEWVIHADADEFWWPNSETIPESLATVPSQFLALQCKSLHFLPRPGKGKALERMVFRHRKPDKNKVCHRGMSNVRVGLGNHRLLEPDVNMFPGNSLFSVLHFPARSYSQYERKIRVGAAAIVNNPGLTAGHQSHWSLRYEDYKNGLLEKYWRENMELGTKKLVAGILSRTLKLDRRLARYFKAHNHGLTSLNRLPTTTS